VYSSELLSLFGVRYVVMSGQVLYAHSSWVQTVEAFLPGSYVAVIGATSEVGVSGRRAGLELRDTIVVLGAEVRTVFLFRKPLSEKTVAEQVLATGTGALHIDACRGSAEGNTTAERTQGSRSREHWRMGVTVGGSRPSSLGRWPPNVILMHTGDCTPTACVSACFSRSIEEIDAGRCYPSLRGEDELLKWLKSLTGTP
jgi:hypothetical protein